MSPLPRIERGDWDGAYRCAKPWKDLGPMFKSIIEGVQETGEPVLSADNVQAKLVGFHMEQLDGGDIRTWTWEIHCDDLNRCLATPEWAHLAAEWRAPYGRARIAATLSQGKMP